MKKMNNQEINDKQTFFQLSLILSGCVTALLTLIISIFILFGFCGVNLGVFFSSVFFIFPLTSTIVLGIVFLMWVVNLLGFDNLKSLISFTIGYFGFIISLLILVFGGIYIITIFF